MCITSGLSYRQKDDIVIRISNSMMISVHYIIHVPFSYDLTSANLKDVRLHFKK